MFKNTNIAIILIIEAGGNNSDTSCSDLKYCVTIGKRPLGRPECRWMDPNKMYLKENRYGIEVAEDRLRRLALLNTKMKLGLNNSREIHNHLCNFQVLKNNPVPWSSFYYYYQLCFFTFWFI